MIAVADMHDKVEGRRVEREGARREASKCRGVTGFWLWSNSTNLLRLGNVVRVHTGYTHTASNLHSTLQSTCNPHTFHNVNDAAEVTNEKCLGHIKKDLPCGGSR